MFKRLIYSIVTFSLIVAVMPVSVGAIEFNPHFLVSDEEMENIFSMSAADVQDFLDEHGALGGYSFEDLDGLKRSAAEIIWRYSIEFDMNPQFMLVLLQREQSLVTDDYPSQRQLDWAMGYAVCDSCSKEDPAIQKYKGFPNQIYYAAKRIRESYLNDLDNRGYTISGMGPDITKTIDGIGVTPTNNATAVLYTYTPHIHGNQNFVRIWHRWFIRNYPTGSLLQDASTGGVWLIQFGKKRPITSRTALLTRYNPDNIIIVQPTVLEAYIIGDPISFPNYSLLKSPRGTIFLLVDDTIRGIDSMETFRGIGFNPDELIDVTFEDIEHYQRGPIISLESVFPQGILLQDTTTGGVWFVENGTKSAIHSREILDQRFPGWPINPESSDELAAYSTVNPVLFPDGTLIAADGSPDIFVVAGGERRWIYNEETFLEYGWKWNKIVWTNERSVLLHNLGDKLDIDLEFVDLQFDDLSEEIEIATP